MFIDIHTHCPPSSDSLCITQGPRNTGDDRVFFSVGIHPWTLGDATPNPSPDKVLEMAIDPRCIALGECGIDRIHRPLVPDAQQIQTFLFHANLAQRLNKPLILHCVRAHEEIIHFRRQFFSAAPAWIYHGFHGSPTLAHQLLKLNIVPSIGPRYLDRAQKDNLQKIFDAGCFIETDNDPMGIRCVYQKFASILEISTETLQKKIETLFRQHFPNCDV